MFHRSICLYAKCHLLLVVALVGCRDSTTTPKVKSPTQRLSKQSPVKFDANEPDRPSGLLPKFRSIGPESGFRFQRFDDLSPRRRITEVNGGGVGVIDFDRDGQADVFMTNGCRLPERVGDVATPGKLFRNLGQMRFRNVSQPSGLNQFGFKHGCAVGDWDADGFDDIYLTAFGTNEFWRNNGDGTFSEISTRMRVDVPQWSSSAAFCDLNRDGFLDLYVVELNRFARRES